MLIKQLLTIKIPTIPPANEAGAKGAAQNKRRKIL
jgi:hypothetical protein